MLNIFLVLSSLSIIIIIIIIIIYTFIFLLHFLETVLN